MRGTWKLKQFQPYLRATFLFRWVKRKLKKSECLRRQTRRAGWVLNRSGIGGNINFMGGGGWGNTEWECRGGNRDVLSFVGKLRELKASNSKSGGENNSSKRWVFNQLATSQRDWSWFCLWFCFVRIVLQFANNRNLSSHKLMLWVQKKKTFSLIIQYDVAKNLGNVLEFLRRSQKVSIVQNLCWIGSQYSEARI